MVLPPAPMTARSEAPQFMDSEDGEWKHVFRHPVSNFNLLLISQFLYGLRISADILHSFGSVKKYDED